MRRILIPHSVGSLAPLSVALIALALGGCGTPSFTIVGDTGDNQGEAIVVVHGAGDNPESFALPLAAELADSTPRSPTVLVVDWEDAASNYLLAAGRGMEVGEGVARQLAGYDPVTVIAHSAGAFVAHAIERNLSGAGLTLVLLDPFTARSIFQWRYGRRQFGSDADYTWVYLNTNDRVPATNAICRNAVNLDVTALVATADNESERHRSPVYWYRATVGDAPGDWIALGFPVGYHAREEDYDSFPKGKLIPVSGNLAP